MTPSIDPRKIRRDVLKWYDKYGRDLPWRKKGEDKPDPYHIWLAEIMGQQTTLQALIPYYLKFIEKWPTVHNLADALQEDILHEWAGLGYYARARNLHKCAKIVSHELKGEFPKTQKGLMSLPGVGEYSSSAMAAILYSESVPVIDGNVERVGARVFAVEAPLPKGKPEIKKHSAMLYERSTNRPGDYAQALMDLGAMVCTPKSPKCGICPISDQCLAFKKGIAAELPKREPKKARPKRYGGFYWITNEHGAVLFERRAENRMLGGMLGLPTTDWDDKTSTAKTPDGLKSVEKLSENHVVHHTFSHFDLELQGYRASYNPDSDRFEWIEPAKLNDLGLPSLFKKAVKMMTK